MELNDLLAVLPGARVDGGRDIDLERIVCDSRQVVAGDLFVAVRGGQEQDRHLFVGDAIARGARAVVVEDLVDCGSTTRVRVADCRAALARLAAHFYAYPGCAMLNVGITGTNGKTTTAFLLRSALESAGLPCGYLGTLGCWINGELTKVDNTTPEAAELQRLLKAMVDAGQQATVLEVSSHGLALKRVEGIPFRIAVFTNLTRDHLDFHGSLEDYFAAKALLFEGLPATGVAVINGDDPVAAKLAPRTPARVVTYGYEDAADVRMERTASGPLGASMRVATPVGTLDVDTHLTGNFNGYNVMAALAVGVALDLDPGELCRGIAALASVPGRFERIREGQDFEVIVDYAHTPDALQRILLAARELAPRRLLCVFGCGGDRDRGKRPEMGQVAGELADLTYLTSDNPRSEDPARILADIGAGVPANSESIAEVDRERAIALALAEAEEGDMVVIAGKGHETEQELADGVISFDDREVARKALGDLRVGRGQRQCAK